MLLKSELHERRPAQSKGETVEIAARQTALLESCRPCKPFDGTLEECDLLPLRASGIEALQVNVGRLCNQRCKHCHVGAGPDCREIMDRGTMQQCLDVIEKIDIPSVDITGGAPEMNPNFRWFVEEVRTRGRRVIDRSNLTIIVAAGYQDLPEFLAGNQVEIIASLPCYREENVNAQRGEGVFAKSLQALRRLNSLGYGRTGSGLQLSLVYNPAGPTLPPPQKALQVAYRRELRTRWGVVFNRLLTMTNMPIGRFLDNLVDDDQLDEYMLTLATGFNPAVVAGAMCRTTLSVDWTGRLFDCDFNQALGLGLEKGLPQHIGDFDQAGLTSRRITTGQHCYGCTAGAGSGCQGAITAEKSAADSSANSCGTSEA